MALLIALAAACTASPHAGRRRVNLGESKRPDAPLPRERIAVITERDDGREVKTTTTGADGMAAVVLYDELLLGGKATIIEPAQDFDAKSRKLIDGHGREVTFWKEGKTIVTERFVVSKFRTKMRVTTRIDAARGRIIERLEAYDRQPPFAGVRKLNPEETSSVSGPLPKGSERKAHLACLEAMMKLGAHMGVRTLLGGTGRYRPPGPSPAAAYDLQDEVWTTAVATSKELARVAEANNAAFCSSRSTAVCSPAQNAHACSSRKWVRHGSKRSSIRRILWR
jgi:hypothetical protein